MTGINCTLVDVKARKCNLFEACLPILQSGLSAFSMYILPCLVYSHIQQFLIKKIYVVMSSSYVVNNYATFILYTLYKLCMHPSQEKHSHIIMKELTYWSPVVLKNVIANQLFLCHRCHHIGNTTANFCIVSHHKMQSDIEHISLYHDSVGLATEGLGGLDKKIFDPLGTCILDTTKSWRYVKVWDIQLIDLSELSVLQANTEVNKMSSHFKRCTHSSMCSAN